MSAPTYAQLLEMYLNCLASISANQSYTVLGKQFTRANLKDVMTVVDWLESKVAADDVTTAAQSGTTTTTLLTGQVLASF